MPVSNVGTVTEDRSVSEQIGIYPMPVRLLAMAGLNLGLWSFVGFTATLII